MRRGCVETELVVLPKTILCSPSFRRSTINATVLMHRRGGLDNYRFIRAFVEQSEDK